MRTALDPLDIQIEAYLDHVEAAMTALPRQERREHRNELRHHLDSTRVALEELGDTPATAVAEALHRFGEPKQIARQFNRAWVQTTPRIEFPLLSMRLGLRWFGVGFVAFLASSIIAAHFGHPFWIETQWSLMGLVLLPCLLGIGLGRQASKRAGMGAFYALAALVCINIVMVGIALLWKAQSFSLAPALAVPAASLLVFWIPIGSLVATATSHIVDMRSR